MDRVRILTAATLLGMGTILPQAAAAADEISQKDIVAVRSQESTIVKQGIPQFHGISGRTANSEAISMHKVTIPPGGKAKPHVHKGYETAVYLLKGRVKTLYGEGLKKSVVNEAGDFLYIPADVPHQPINLSDTETAEAIVARTDPNEQESVHDYPN